MRAKRFHHSGCDFRQQRLQRAALPRAKGVGIAYLSDQLGGPVVPDTPREALPVVVEQFRWQPGAGIFLRDGHAATPWSSRSESGSSWWSWAVTGLGRAR